MVYNALLKWENTLSPHLYKFVSNFLVQEYLNAHEINQG